MRYAIKGKEDNAKRSEDRKINPEKYRAREKAKWERNKLKPTTNSQRLKRSAISKRYRERNPELVKAREIAYRKANPEKVRAINKAWREANHEHIRQYNRDHPEVGRRKDDARRRRQFNLPPLTADERKAVRDFTRTVKQAVKVFCYWCGKSVPKRQRHIDHIVPMEKGGSLRADNLCCACARCNLSKGGKLPQEFNGQHLLPL